jgi:hypothetical protein
MFYQLVNDRANEQHSLHNAKALFHSNPLVITAFVEDAWRNSQSENEKTFPAWPRRFTNILKQEFCEEFEKTQHRQFHGAVDKPLMLHHLIYAYLIESTGIYEIFRKVLETYNFGEDQLDAPARPSQQFWRNTEYVAYSNPLPTTVWNLLGTTRSDETALRRLVYWRMFGADILHFGDSSHCASYPKPVLANVDFFSTFEAFLGQVWRGITNRKNFVGMNNTSISAIAELACQLNHALLTRRQHGNLSREEFRSVMVMEWLHTATRFPPVISELLASGQGSEQTLFKIAARVGMEAHPKSKQLFELAPPCSALLTCIEKGTFNDCKGVHLLLNHDPLYCLVDEVITLYEIAFGRNLRDAPLSLSGQSGANQPLAITRRQAPVQVRQLAVAQTR